MIEKLLSLLPKDLTDWSLLVLVVSVVLIFIYDFYNTRNTQDNDSSTRLLKEFSEKKAAARQLANFAEDFNARFKHIREAYPYPDERDKLAKGGDVHLIRLKDANESFNRMYELFNSIKYDLVNRKGIEDNTQKLWVLLQKYSNDVNLWKQNPSQKILENAVLHKGADKVMKEADTIAETIKELLTPNMYPNVTRISYERFNSHDKINPKDDQDNKKDNP